MPDGISMQMLLLVGALGLMLAFLVGQAMHGVMRDQGFGPLGNTLVLASGFTLGLSLVARLGYGSLPVDKLTAAAIAVAFLVLLLTAAFKRFVLHI